MRNLWDFLSSWITGRDGNYNRVAFNYHGGCTTKKGQAYPGKYVNATKFLKGFQVGLESRKYGERWERKREKYTRLSTTKHCQYNQTPIVKDDERTIAEEKGDIRVSVESLWRYESGCLISKI